MPVDYKYIDHDNPPGKNLASRLFTRFIIIALLAIVAVYGTCFWQTRHVEEWILTGQYPQAEKNLDRWKWVPLVNGRIYEKLGTAKLLQQGAPSAESDFATAEKKLFFAPISIWPDVLKVLWGNARYSDGLSYSNHLQKHLPNEPSIHFYRAGFLTGTNDLDAAAKEIAQLGNAPDFAKEASALKSEINQRQTTGTYTLLYDRENLPLASRSLKGENSVLIESLKPLLQNPTFGYLSTHKDSSAQAVLTYDYRIQNAALKSLGQYAGAMVVMDVKNGDILAAASSTKGAHADYPPDSVLAYSNFYEPGSIIKIITLAGALEHNVDFSKIFPLTCEGKMILSNNKVLSDWKVHGEVKDINQAMAVSCNIAFAKIGLSMKPSDLIANLKQFGFDSRLSDTSFPVDLGRIDTGEMNDLYLGNISIGLLHLKMTPLHAALMAASIANGGSAPLPRQFLHYQNMIGVPYGTQAPAEYRRFMSQKSAETIARAMQEVVQNSDGTGRRAAIDNFPFAMKTGTSGESTFGYNAVVVGFAPLENPKIAFAIVLEHAGKAEFEGARITKLFLESIKGYI